MVLSAIIITTCFIISILLIITNKVNRAIAVLSGAVITYLVLTFVEGRNVTIFIDFLFGTPTDGFVNLRAIILIIGVLFIVQICQSAGVFQVGAFKLIQLTKGNSTYLLLVFCLLSVLLSAILNNILSVIVLIPLTVVSSRILGIDPSPYILCEAILVNIGAILFPISSIPNILITTYATISFLEFFVNVGLFAFFLFAITFVYFYLKYKDKLMIPKERAKDVLKDFNVWNYVPDKKLFYKAALTLLIVMICFLIVPSTILPLDMIAFMGGLFLLIISKLNAKEIYSKIDLELILYLFGIFIITGGMESVGVLNLIGAGLIFLTGSNSLIVILTILWFSAFLSSTIDNIPITQVLIPVIDVMTLKLPSNHVKTAFYSLAYGANLGDNLTPLGDNVIVMNIAEQNERPISFSEFLKLGFTATIIQLCAISLYYTLMMETYLGLIILSFVLLIISLFFLRRYLKRKNINVKLKINEFIKKLRLKIRIKRPKKTIIEKLEGI
ncbi:MAG: hypothetical protein EAX96_02275 [Candidatus Lokiarchaeota archaeon]|nr:hypothetical protein [Candidatus Lokiarchaeota archaeon]